VAVGSGNVYAADFSNHRIQKFTSDGVYLGQWGGLGSDDGQFDLPVAVAVDGKGHVFVTEEGANSRIQEFTSSGVYVKQWGSRGTGDGQFDPPQGLAVDTSGHIFVADWHNNRIQVFSAFGTVPTKSTSWGRIKALYR
jgi:sugar lactone lactonase YvrE